MNYSDVPYSLREPGVLSGYRKIGQKWNFYLVSIFRMHNESLNIWTHIFAFVWHFLLLYHYAPTCNSYTDIQCGTVLIFSFCCLLSTSFSVIAHIFHTKSAYVHRILFLLDYTGVIMYCYVTGLIAIQYFSDKTTYKVIAPFYFVIHWIFCLVEFITMCVLKLNLGETSGHLPRKWTVIFVYALHGVLISSTVAGKYWRYVHGDVTNTTSLWRYNWIYLTFTLEALAYACHVPELLFPGSFDIIGQSHQMFHVIATITQTLQINAVHYEIEQGNVSYVDQNSSKLGVSTVLLFVVSLCSIYVLASDKFRQKTGSKKSC